jgi:hypothetical protein
VAPADALLTGRAADRKDAPEMLDKTFEKLRHLVAAPIRELRREVEESKLLTARLLVRDVRGRGVLPRLQDAEFKVFSQFGDDGIIQYLVHLLAPLPRTFIEFGTEDYSESNTRFLLVNDDWRGLIMDGSKRHMADVRAEEYHWRHDLTAVSAFVDRDNVNGLFRDAGFSGELGLLSVDIDGNDYWVWERIEAVSPVVTICEYNAVFGGSRAVTVPYDPGFDRTRAHPSNLYWGASLKALCLLAERKGLAFVGTNSAGNNAYFVRRDRLGPLRPLTAEEGFTDASFRESRDERGRLTFLSGEARRAAIADMEVVDVELGKTVRVGELAPAGSRA